MTLFRTVLLETFIANKLVKTIVQPSLTRLYATGPNTSKKDKKTAKKLADLAAEPQHFQSRRSKWTELTKKYDLEVVAKGQQLIKVALLDGKIIEGFSWELTPLDVAKSINSVLASAVYVAKIDNALWDLERPIETDCQIELFKLDSPDAKAALWLTAACTLAESLERLYIDHGGIVCNIGSTQTGFFTDLLMKDKTINRKDFAAIEEQIAKTLNLFRGKVERIVISKSDALDLFNHPLKAKTINDRSSDRVPIYRCGSFIEMSDTPMLRHNKKVNAFKLLKVESVIFNGENVHRIHGVAFPSAKELKEFVQSNRLS